MSKPTIFDGMMHEVCVGTGFCGSIIDGQIRHVTDYFPNSGVITAEEFASWVLEAEGMSIQDERAYWHSLKAVFTKHMGSDAVDADYLNRLIAY